MPSITKQNMRLSPRIVIENPVNGYTHIKVPSMVAEFLMQLFNTYGQRSDYFATCITCLHWKDGCSLADGQMPPPKVIANGCSEYEDADIVPF